VVVGEGAAASWQFALQVLWESGFRVGELMDFSWDDRSRVHPVWPTKSGRHPTILVPSSQKNGRVQEVPLLPGLEKLLQRVPKSQRQGWIVNPEPMEYEIRSTSEWLQPRKEDLKKLMIRFSNSAIARACHVSETTVRNWLRENSLKRNENCRQEGRDIPNKEIETLRQTAVRRRGRAAQRRTDRLTKERVSRVIAMIGRKAGVVVQQANDRTGRRLKHASAHDLRRGFAERLINIGVSAETLKVVMRHRDFGTTEKHYGALRSTQSAGTELREKLATETNPATLVGGTKKAPQLNAEELGVLKSLLSML
jgi:integrase